MTRSRAPRPFATVTSSSSHISPVATPVFSPPSPHIPLRLLIRHPSNPRGRLATAPRLLPPRGGRRSDPPDPRCSWGSCARQRAAAAAARGRVPWTPRKTCTTRTTPRKMISTAAGRPGSPPATTGMPITTSPTTTPTTPGSSSPTGCSILSEADIKQRQEDDINRVSTVLSISKSEACVLLRNYNCYEATSSRHSRSFVKEITTAAVASVFLGFGSLFVVLASGVYV